MTGTAGARVNASPAGISGVLLRNVLLKACLNKGIAVVLGVALGLGGGWKA